MADLDPTRPLLAAEVRRRRHPLEISVRGVVAGIYVQVVVLGGVAIVDRFDVAGIPAMLIALVVALVGWLILLGPNERRELRGVGRRRA